MFSVYRDRGGRRRPSSLFVVEGQTHRVIRACHIASPPPD